jgi:NAD(P) transhydrogenase
MLTKQAQAENKIVKSAAKSYDFDAIIIGTGPSGESAAMNLAKRVAII